MQANMQYIRDAEGYMVNPEDWDEDFARQIAAEEDLELTEEYWSIIHFMRDFWEQQRIAPDVRHVIKHLVETHGYDKKLAKERLFKLFPYGYVKQSCKIAGMKRPRVWSTG